MNLNSTVEKTNTYGVTYHRERFADWGVAWAFACAAGSTRRFLVIDYGREQDGAFFIDLMDYAPHAFPEGKPTPGRRFPEGGNA